jgi:hypothetical protein
MAEHFVLSENNPNDGIGGGGCLCNPRWDEDREGPFFLFPGTATDDDMSPHAVVCAGCVKSMCRKLDSGAEALNAGERGDRPKPGRRKQPDVPVSYTQTGIGPIDAADELDI